MKVIVLADYAEVSKQSAGLIEEKVSENEDAVLGLATGATPLGLDENLIDGHKTSGISYKM